MKSVKNFKSVKSLVTTKVCSGKLNGKVIFDAYKKDGEEIPSNTFVSNISSVVPQRKRRPDEKLVESYIKRGYRFSEKRKAEIQTRPVKKEAWQIMPEFMQERQTEWNIDKLFNKILG